MDIKDLEIVLGLAQLFVELLVEFLEVVADGRPVVKPLQILYHKLLKLPQTLLVRLLQVDKKLLLNQQFLKKLELPSGSTFLLIFILLCLANLGRLFPTAFDIIQNGLELSSVLGHPVLPESSILKKPVDFVNVQSILQGLETRKRFSAFGKEIEQVLEAESRRVFEEPLVEIVQVRDFLFDEAGSLGALRRPLDLGLPLVVVSREFRGQRQFAFELFQPVFGASEEPMLRSRVPEVLKLVLLEPRN